MRPDSAMIPPAKISNTNTHATVAGRRRRSAGKGVAVAAKGSAPIARYLNVDLEIRSASDLQPLADAVAGRLLVLHTGKVNGSYFLSLEVPGLSSQPDAAIKELGQAISALPAAAPRLRYGGG